VYNSRIMADARDLVREWQDAMQGLASAARGAAGRSELPKQLLSPMQRQAELLQEVLELQRRLQGEVIGRLLEPADALFDLLEQSGATFRQQSEALEQASQALEETAKLMKAQAELFEKSIKLMREPTELAKSAAGVKKGSGGRAKKPGGGSRKKKSS
jgi:methyl-accepting chemotaxis protein